MIMNLRASRDFTSYSDLDVGGFTRNHIACMNGNPAFPNPPVPLVPITLTSAQPGGQPNAAADGQTDMTTLEDVFEAAITAAYSGGPQQTAAKEAARSAVLDALRKNANYVQTLASHDLEMLLSSGFTAVSTNRAQAPLDQPVIATIENLGTTKLLVRATPILNARNYQVQMSTGTGAWQDVGIFTQARRIVLESLTPGTIYNVRLRALGGSTGYSDWCVAAALMAT